MRLVVLGSTGYHPNEARQTLCLLLPEVGVMLDAGTGMFRAAEFLATDTLDIFLSHAHLDHVIGLTFLFDVLYQRPLARVTVHGDAAKLAAIERHLFADELFPLRPPFEAQPLGDRVVVPGGGVVRHFPLRHPGGVVGYRLDWPGHSLAYVTDTTASADADYIEQVRGVDLLVHECYFPDGQQQWAVKTGHSCLTPVAEAARAADVGRVLLVHLNPLLTDPAAFDLTSAQRIFRNLTLAEDRMVVEF